MILIQYAYKGSMKGEWLLKHLPLPFLVTISEPFESDIFTSTRAKNFSYSHWQPTLFYLC